MKPKAFRADCAHCPLATRPFCPSSIPADATLTIIGEAPGTQEIIDRVPFIGPSGTVLDHALVIATIDPATVAKTNAVLCRPFGNEDPPDAAIAACSARLAYDIQLAGAEHILAAGNVAVRALDALAERVVSGGILARAGHTYEYHSAVVANCDTADDPIVSLQNRTYKYTATVNPAYILHADPYFPSFLRHIQLAVSPRERDFDIDAIRYAIVTPENMRSVIAYIDSFDPGDPMSFDVEADHLQWYTTPARDAAELLCFVLAFEDDRAVIVPTDMYAYAEMRECVENALDKYNVIAQNGKFDQDFMAASVATHFQIDDDTMLMHYALYELGGHGLKELATEYLGAPNYEEILITSWFRANGMAHDVDRRYSALPKDRLYKYVAIDGVVTLQLWRLFRAELVAKGLYDEPYRRVLMETANALPIVEQTGIGIDREQLAHARIELECDLGTLETQMTQMITPLIAQTHNRTAAELQRLMHTRVKVREGEINPKTNKRRRATYEDALIFNPRSNPQVHYVLYGLLGLTLQKRLIKPTRTNTGKEALEALPDHPFTRLLRQHRRIAKMCDTYIASIERRATIADLIHVDFRITGTEIGRLSASNADHGIPRPDDYYGALIRSIFVANPHDTDEVLVIGDYSQAELRAFAYLANVRFLLEKYKEGKDVHTETALLLETHGAPIFQGFAQALQDSKHADEAISANAKAFIKARRVLAKNTNFGNIYQGGAMGISGMIGGAIPANVIREVLLLYNELMPEARAYAISQFEFLLAHGYVKTVFNRHRRFYIISEQNKEEARKAVVHSVVAGSAADLNNLSAARLVRAGVRVCHLVHDNIIARAKRDEAAHVARLMQETMIAVGNEAMPGVPWAVDIDTLPDGSFPRRWVETPRRSDYDAQGKRIR